MGYQDWEQLDRARVDDLSGRTLLEFGAEWCPHCQALQEPLRNLLAEVGIEFGHYQISDGKGKPLGRSFQVKLWPNLVFLKDGQLVEQLARPDVESLRAALQKWRLD